MYKTFNSENKIKRFCRLKMMMMEKILTLQTTFTFPQILGQDELVDVFDVLIHIITSLIVTALLLYTAGAEKQSNCTLKCFEN